MRPIHPCIPPGGLFRSDFKKAVKASIVVVRVLVEKFLLGKVAAGTQEPPQALCGGTRFPGPLKPAQNYHETRNGLRRLNVVAASGVRRLMIH